MMNRVPAAAESGGVSCPIPKASPLLLAILLAASALLTGSCRQSPPTGGSTASQSSANPAVHTPELRAEDFDPPPQAPAALKLSGQKEYRNLTDFVAIGPRFLGSPGHAKAEQFILGHLEGAQVEQDKFTAQTAAGPFAMNNIIARFPGTKDGIIVLAGHYDTNYPLRNTSFIGANDGGSNVGLMLELASQLRLHPPRGYGIWLLFTDGEEATVNWTDADSIYGSKQLAKQWASDGTAAKIKAFLLLDMIGDKDLDIDRDSNSTPWLLDVVYRAAQRLDQQSHFFVRTNTIGDDHLPFAAAGIPVADIIDIDYGFDNIYHHTTQDTPDKCSAASLQIVSDVVMETIRALNTH
jgi:glutaminyl-peptide cyclotransferase